MVKMSVFTHMKLSHVIIQMVHDPDREEDYDEDDRDGGNKNN